MIRYTFAHDERESQKNDPTAWHMFSRVDGDPRTDGFGSYKFRDPQPRTVTEAADRIEADQKRKGHTVNRVDRIENWSGGPMIPGPSSKVRVMLETVEN